MYRRALKSTIFTSNLPLQGEQKIRANKKNEKISSQKITEKISSNESKLGKVSNLGGMVSNFSKHFAQIVPGINSPGVRMH